MASRLRCAGRRMPSASTARLLKRFVPLAFAAAPFVSPAAPAEPALRPVTEVSEPALRPVAEVAAPGLRPLAALGAYRSTGLQIPASLAALKEEAPRELPTAPASRPPQPYESAGRKSYLIPALEIVAFDVLLNLFDRAYFGCCDYDVNGSSIKRNLRRNWVTDNDPHEINQLGHPYQGSIYHNFARSAGLSYWEALGYTFAGSIFWEIAGETTPPSKNDQVASGIGGTFLGESLFRMAHLLYDKGGGLSPFWREVAGAAISPANAFNRLAYGKRFPQFASRDPAYYSRVAIGASGTTQDVPGTATELQRNEGILDYSLEYGLPGKPGYTYTRPFDYFSFQATLSTANGFENLLTRGLLVGKEYGNRDRYRGVWGLYGSYDYIAPQIFRLSSTALSLGTTGEWIINRSFALQGTAMAGAGYASASTLHSQDERDYHYGIAPQALLALRLIYADRASLDLTAREYFVSKVASDRDGRGGDDNIIRAEAAFTYRIHKRHAISVKYLWTRRDAQYPVLGDRTQTRATLGIFYTLLGRDGFGAYDWR
jgi:hypothetical protein